MRDGFWSRLSFLVLACALVLPLAACPPAEEEGVMEEAGEALDEAMGEVEEAADEAMAEGEEAMDEMMEEVEEMGEEVEEAAEEVGEGGGS